MEGKDRWRGRIDGGEGWRGRIDGGTLFTHLDLQDTNAAFLFCLLGPLQISLRGKWRGKFNHANKHHTNVTDILAP